MEFIIELINYKINIFIIFNDEIIADKVEGIVKDCTEGAFEQLKLGVLMDVEPDMEKSIIKSIKIPTMPDLKLRTI